MVTGASSGIGREIAVGCAALGAKVVLCARKGSRAFLCDGGACAKSVADSALAISCDVTDEQSVKTWQKRLRNYGRIDGLVNSAGITYLQDAAEFDMDRFRQVLDVNLNGTMICCKVLGGYMLRQGHGRVVNVSSVRGLQVKSAIRLRGVQGRCDMLTKSLAVEWAKKGINVNAVAPTFTLTDMNQGLLEDTEKYSWVLSRIPKGQLCEREQLVGPVVYFLSPCSEFVTGDIMYVDGGWTAG